MCGSRQLSTAGLAQVVSCCFLNTATFATSTRFSDLIPVALGRKEGYIRSELRITHTCLASEHTLICSALVCPALKYFHCVFKGKRDVKAGSGCLVFPALPVLLMHIA